MKTPKRPSKEPSFPSQDEARRINVLQEKLLSEFRTFGESLSAVRERVDRMEPDLHAVKEDVAVLKSAARSHTDAINANTVAIHSLQTDVATLKSDVFTLKSDVAEIKSDIKGYTHRVDVLETKIAP